MVKTSWIEGLVILMRVTFALILRETKTRYGRLQIGYLWAFIEPILYVLVLSLIFSYIKKRDSLGMPLIQFLTTGILPFILFRDTLTQTMTAIKPNLQLLYFPQVQIFDIGLSRALLEYATFLIIFPLIIFLISFSGVETVIIEDPLGILVASIMIALYAYGLGTAIGSLIPLFPSLQFLVQAIYLRPLFFLSGVFFTVYMIPEGVRPYAVLNPLLQLIEMVRSSYSPTYESSYINYPYLISSILGVIFIGLLMQRALRRYAFQA